MNASTDVGVYVESLQEVIANYSRWNFNCFVSSLQSAYFKEISFKYAFHFQFLYIVFLVFSFIIYFFAFFVLAQLCSPDIDSFVVSISHRTHSGEKSHDYNFSAFLAQLSVLAHALVASPARDEVNTLFSHWVKANCTPSHAPPPPPIPQTGERFFFFLCVYFKWFLVHLLTLRCRYSE
jgi:hypothetical protein